MDLILYRRETIWREKEGQWDRDDKKSWEVNTMMDGYEKNHHDEAHYLIVDIKND